LKGFQESTAETYESFVAADQNHLWTHYIVRLEEHAVPSRVARASGKPWPPGVLFESGDTVDQVAVALPEPRTVLAMLGDNLEIQMLAEVELSDKSFAAVNPYFRFQIRGWGRRC